MDRSLRGLESRGHTQVLFCTLQKLSFGTPPKNIQRGLDLQGVIWFNNYTDIGTLEYQEAEAAQEQVCVQAP